MDRIEDGARPPVRGIALGVVVACSLALAGWVAPDTGPAQVTAAGATWTATDAPGGLVVTSLETGGPSQMVGLRVGDVIDRVDGLDMPTPAMLVRAGTDDDVAVLHVAARGDVGGRTLLLRRAEVGQGEDPDRRGR